MDPISSQFPHVSTYNYAENEPIGHIDLWGLQKMKPNFRYSENFGQLLYNMPNNVYEGTKVALREYFNEEVSDGFKNLGSSLEYGGYIAGMTGHAEVTALMVFVGKSLSLWGTGVGIVNEVIENKNVSTDTWIDISVDATMGVIFPEPFENAIDNLGMDKAATTAFKAHRDANLKAGGDAVKEGLKNVVSNTDEDNDAEVENCEEICVDQ